LTAISALSGEGNEGLARGEAATLRQLRLNEKPSRLGFEKASADPTPQGPIMEKLVKP
jgi:hypothetical protein